MFDNSFVSALNDFCNVVDTAMQNMRTAINELLDNFDTEDEKRAAACLLVASLHSNPPRGFVVDNEYFGYEEGK